MADVKAQGEACLSSWFIPLAGWPALLRDEGPHPPAYQRRNTVAILTSQSLFSDYFTHYGSRWAQSHPVHSVCRIKINLNIQRTVAVLWLWHNQDVLNNLTIIVEWYFEVKYFLLVPEQLISTLGVIKTSFTFTAAQISQLTAVTPVYYLVIILTKTIS